MIKRALASADVPSILEPAGLTRRDGKRPDGLTLIPWKEGRCLVWDFTCSDTVAQSHLQGTARAAGAAAETAELRKFTHYEDLAVDYIIAPVAIETLGAMGPATEKFIGELSKRLISVIGDKKAGFYFRQRLSIAIQRGNCLSVLGTMDKGDALLVDW